MQDISKSLKIRIISVYLCQVKKMQREAAYQLEIQTQEVKVHKGCKRTYILGGGDLGGRDNEMRSGRTQLGASKFMKNSTPLF